MAENYLIVLTVALALVCGVSMSVKNREEGKKWGTFNYILAVLAVVAFVYVAINVVLNWPIEIAVNQEQLIIYYIVLLFLAIQVITNIVDTVKCKKTGYRIIYAVVTLIFIAGMAVFVLCRA